ncbi:hypothetical protein [Gloeobacter violaceus]|uniref:hypothetical protein n=1 Tax=Gloeobacter violaceus TaxID=33072 RepID=UPI0013E8D30F|nr:hypothetical protein [Gloeobacter violaceus]
MSAGKKAREDISTKANTNTIKTVKKSKLPRIGWAPDDKKTISAAAGDRILP